MKFFIRFAIVMTLLFIFGCKEGNNGTPVVPTFANIEGSVNLYDEGVIPVDNAEMKIVVEGLIPEIMAITDSEGNFSLENVPFGTYTLVYTKSGYGTFKNVNIEHIDTGEATLLTAAPSLGSKTSTSITNLSVKEESNEVFLSASIHPDASISSTKFLRFFYSTNSAVGPDNYLYYSDGLVARINPYELVLTADQLQSYGFPSETVVYVKVFGDSFWSNEYVDSALGRKIFPNLNETASGAVSFIVP